MKKIFFLLIAVFTFSLYFSQFGNAKELELSILNQTKKELENFRESDGASALSEFSKGFMTQSRGLGSLGILPMIDRVQTAILANKVRQGEDITEDEKNALKAAAMAQDINNNLHLDSGRSAYRTGKSVAVAVIFIEQILALSLLFIIYKRKK